MTLSSQVAKVIDAFPVLGRMFREVRERQAIKELRWAIVPGHQFGVLGGNWVAAGVRSDSGSLHEQDELIIISSLLSDANILLDVGANSGIFSCLAASKGVKSLAFEALPSNLQILLESVKRNGFDQLVEVFTVAVAAGVGIAHFYGRGQGASLIKGWGGRAEYDSILVPTNTLDTLAHHRVAGGRFVLKIDVEGAELSVLRGAERILQEGAPVLIEISLTRNQPGGLNGDFLAVFEILWGHGYASFIADKASTPVSREMVRGWIEGRAINIGTENFLFLSCPPRSI